MQQYRIIKNITDEEYDKYSVIKPPPEYVGDVEKYTRVIIDSRVRNTNLFPNPNDYEVPFEDDINDVITAELLYIDIKFTAYTINQYFNKLVINYGGTDHNIILDTGDYDNTTLKAEIQSKMDTALGSGVVTISDLTKRGGYTFTSASVFTLKFAQQTNTIGLLLGFRDTKDYLASGTGPYTVDSEFRKNFEYNNYIIMDIEQFDLLKSIDKNLNKTFAIISNNNVNIANFSDSTNYIKKFSPPIPRLNKLRIRLYDRFGNNYDCQNMDHRFELSIKSHRQHRRYGNIFAN